MIYPRVFLKIKEDEEIRHGFPWVYDNEISHIKHRKTERDEWCVSSLEETSEDSVGDGSAVEVFTKAGGFLGTGIINRKSKITIRLISDIHADKIFEDIYSFWEKKIFDAVNIRRLNYSDEDSYRLVFGEADFVPGFICERYRDVKGRVFLVVQFLSLSAEIFKNEILKALGKYASPDGIYERDDDEVRLKEGLNLRSGWIGKSFDNIFTIEENGVLLEVNVAVGQKTGYFLDQKKNRAVAASYCKGKKLLDAFCHTGAFALNAFKNGAREAVLVDLSDDALKTAEKNISLNGANDALHIVKADVFSLLKEYEASGERFDVIILDPPAFAKSVKSIQKAYGGYKEINLRAMRLLNSGGILVTCSCSYFFDSHSFYDMIMHAASDSHRRVQILEKRGAGPDHPILSGYSRSEYLKCAVCRVM